MKKCTSSAKSKSEIRWYYQIKWVLIKCLPHYPERNHYYIFWKSLFFSSISKRAAGNSCLPLCFCATWTGEHSSQLVWRALSDCYVYEILFLLVKEMSLTHQLIYEFCFMKATADLRLVFHQHCSKLLWGVFAHSKFPFLQRSPIYSELLFFTVFWKYCSGLGWCVSCNTNM